MSKVLLEYNFVNLLCEFSFFVPITFETSSQLKHKHCDHLSIQSNKNRRRKWIVQNTCTLTPQTWDGEKLLAYLA